MIRPPYVECPECGSADTTRSTVRDRCHRCGHAAPRFVRRPDDPLAGDLRPRLTVPGGKWVRPTCRDAEA